MFILFLFLRARPAPGVRVLSSETRALRLALEELDLPRELLGERAVDLPVARPVGKPPEAAAAMAVVVPARIIEDRIQADPLDGHALPPRRRTSSAMPRSQPARASSWSPVSATTSGRP